MAKCKRHDFTLLFAARRSRKEPAKAIAFWLHSMNRWICWAQCASNRSMAVLQAVISAPYFPLWRPCDVSLTVVYYIVNYMEDLSFESEEHHPQLPMCYFSLQNKVRFGLGANKWINSHNKSQKTVQFGLKYAKLRISDVFVSLFGSLHQRILPTRRHNKHWRMAHETRRAKPS